DFGRPPAAGTDEAIVHEFLLYRWGVRSDAEVRACLGQTVRVEFAGSESRRPEVLLALFDADPTRLTEDELRAMAKARELLPKSVEAMDLSPEEKAALLRALGRKRKKDPADKEYPPETATFRIVGVFRDQDRKRDGDLAELFDEGLRADVVIPGERAEAVFARIP